MVHSIELLLEDEAEAAIKRQWRLLADAGLPSEHRPAPGTGSRRPHVTVVACEQIPMATATGLGPTLAEALPLPVTIGVPMIFGTAKVGRPGLILVRQVLANVRLLELQQRLKEGCPQALDGHFDEGRWAPHVTLARRLRPDQIPVALQLLARTGASNGAPREMQVNLTGARFWQGDLKQARNLL
ncbi:2'-5' RNA ligase family protein [Microlunatus elymi]|uniref:2'-5' RNA ligase family protein n=1 Tax=Microlunatus elymi TaxID=2596828 RepID=UPI00143CC916|nr:2'-5' RNA ligase family protein [Microlunatus elymi]